MQVPREDRIHLDILPSRGDYDFGSAYTHEQGLLRAPTVPEGMVEGNRNEMLPRC